MSESLGIVQFFSGKYLAALNSFDEAIQTALVAITITSANGKKKKGKKDVAKQEAETRDVLGSRNHARMATLVS